MGGWCGDDVVGGFVNDVLHTTHLCTHAATHAPTHAPTHAQCGLPVNPNPVLTPPNRGASGLHDTAAVVITNSPGTKSGESHQTIALSR